MAVMVTGGAGYIGSHVAAELARRNEKVVIIDDLSTGRRQNVPPRAVFVPGDATDPRTLDIVFRGHDIEAVMHFAAFIKVEESKRVPLVYYRNNAFGTLKLLQKMLEYGTSRMVFSSTAAVYGEPDATPVREDAPTVPLTPYGASKLMAERMLDDMAAAHGFRHVALRYFNVLGVGHGHERGYPLEPKPSHLVRAALARAFGLKDPLPIFGTDYPTHDGTAIRDYIHIDDLVNAHVRSLAYLRDGGGPATLNVGYGHGYSVREVVQRVGEVCGRDIPTVLAERRPGDPAAIVADSSRIRELLQWEPCYGDLGAMIESQYRWERELRKV